MRNTFVMAESVKVDSNETNFTLEIEDANGDRYTIILTGIDLDAFYDSVKGRIGPYLRERDDARRTALVTAAAQHVEDSTDALSSGAYDISDPKHPRYHSVHADLYDQREGK